MKSRPCNCCHFFSLSLSSLPLLALRKKKNLLRALEKESKKRKFSIPTCRVERLPADADMFIRCGEETRGNLSMEGKERERGKKKEETRWYFGLPTRETRYLATGCEEGGGEKRDRGKKSMITMINSREWARPFKISGSALLNKDAKERFGARATRIYGNKVAIDDRA